MDLIILFYEYEKPMRRFIQMANEDVLHEAFTKPWSFKEYLIPQTFTERFFWNHELMNIIFDNAEYFSDKTLEAILNTLIDTTGKTLPGGDRRWLIELLFPREVAIFDAHNKTNEGTMTYGKFIGMSSKKF